MRPTNEQLNGAMAESVGWRKVTPDHPHYCGSLTWTTGWVQPVTSWFENCPDYCHDRNSLVEVYDLLRNSDKRYAFSNMLCYAVLNHNHFISQQDDLMDLLASPPRSQVVAALKALGKWPDEWEGDI